MRSIDVFAELSLEMQHQQECFEKGGSVLRPEISRNWNSDPSLTAGLNDSVEGAYVSGTALDLADTSNVGCCCIG